ncbi:putative baseplate assembly protein [Nakamurella sp.]|uniref:putative baseplate assembly protein n=1 Tax=Nakamurella sp. TaxID=1869182 RepID=UPI003B3BAF75
MTATTLLDRRRQLIQQQGTLNGIDHIEVVPPPPDTGATQLRVSFVNPLAALPSPTQIQVTGGDRIPTLTAVTVGSTDDPATILVTLAGGGDLSTYLLRLIGGLTDPTPPTWVDPVLAGACFTFALDCGTDLPCVDDPPCPPAAVTEPALDYLARDWSSLRAVLLDRLSVLQPDWTQRDVADVRVALVELLAELGDRASYRQDAIATEAYLGTARRRVSVRRHARLVDYPMSDGTNARVWVQLAVPDGVVLSAGPGAAVVPAGTRLLTGSPDAPVLISIGSPAEADARRGGALDFVTMHGLTVLSGAHSSMTFYTWSGARPGLPAGCTVATLTGHLPDLAPGQVLILLEHRDPVGESKAVADADPTRRHPVRLTSAQAFDGPHPLVDPLTGVAITEIAWGGGDALPWPLLVEGTVTVGGGTEVYPDGALALGNVVLADHGRPQPPVEFGPVPEQGRPDFRFPQGPLTQVGRTLPRRAGPGGPGAEQQVVTFDPEAPATAATSAAPDLVLPDVGLTGSDLVPWRVQRDLVSSGTNRDLVIEVDDDGIGALRFGRDDDGGPVNGMPPPPGMTIRATYRTGNGVAGNVAAEAIRSILDDGTIAADLRAVLTGPGAPKRVWNPLPGTGGTEPETVEQVRQRAPFAFRSQQRCVTADDYAARAAQFGTPGPARIQRAVASIRWTGSWHVVVVAVDPIGTETADATFLAEVHDYLDQFRMAGHDLQVVAARYASLEVGLAVHLSEGYRRDLVRADLLEVMSNRRLPDGRLGLFHPDRLTFGTAVYLGPIIAAAQAVPGVGWVEATRFSRYRQSGADARADGRIEIGPDEIARLDNDPNRPERGRFHLDALDGGR